jgi:hypothetical protein
MRLASVAIAVTTSALLLAAAPAMAGGTVSSKATAAINDAVGCTATGEQVVNGTASTLVVNCTDLFHHSAVPVTTDQYVPIMDAVIKLSNSQSLFVGASEVTGLYTQTSVTTHGNQTSTATAEGGVYLRAVACPFTGSGNTASLGYCVAYPLTNPAVNVGFPGASCPATVDLSSVLGCAPGQGVVIDQRIQTLSSSVSNCIVTVGTSTGTCSFDQTISLLLDTTSAHTMNFVFPNLAVGSWVVEIQAAVNADATVAGGNGTFAIGGAAYGLGAMTVDSVRLVSAFSF